MFAAGHQPRSAHAPAWPLPAARPSRPWADGRRRAGARLLARWRADALDRQLASGAAIRANAPIAARARQLTTPRNRRRLAAGLERVLGGACHPTHGLTAAIAPCRSEVLDSRVVIATLYRRLRDGDAVDPAGVAMLRILLVDGTGPLYSPHEPGTLGSRLRTAAAALEPERR